MDEVFYLVILAVLCIALAVIVFRPKKVFVCKYCHAQTTGKNRTEGNIHVEGFMRLLFLILFFIGDFFMNLSVYVSPLKEANAHYKVCEFCGSHDLVPIDSLAAHKILIDRDQNLNDPL